MEMNKMGFSAAWAMAGSLDAVYLFAICTDVWHFIPPYSALFG